MNTRTCYVQAVLRCYVLNVRRPPYYVPVPYAT